MPKQTSVHNHRRTRQHHAQPKAQPPQAQPDGGADSRQEGGKHYVAMGVQPWNVIDSWPLEQRVGFYRGNAVKYLMRMGTKDENIQELRKGRHYLDKLIEVLSDTPQTD